jgi:multidrug efflux pump
MQWWSQLSTALVCGLAFSTVLTLVFTPCMLKLRHVFKHWLARRRGLESAS